METVRKELPRLPSLHASAHLCSYMFSGLPPPREPPFFPPHRQYIAPPTLPRDIAPAILSLHPYQVFLTTSLFFPVYKYAIYPLSRKLLTPFSLPASALILCFAAKLLKRVICIFYRTHETTIHINL